MRKQDFVKALVISLIVMVFAAVVMMVVFNKDGGGNKDASSKLASTQTSSKSSSSQVSSNEVTVQSSSRVETSSKQPSSEQTSSKQTSSKTSSVKQETKEGLKYVDGILIVNKTYSVPKDYGNGLTAETSAAFKQLQAAAKQDNLNLWIASGYRSYARQQTLYTNYCNQRGKSEADRFSARPGHSEHQTGLAIDVNNPSSSFEGTPEAVWLEKNCAKYGFIIRYGKDKESSTGFKYEPWHIRYVGVELAQKITASGKSIEEYYGLTSVYAN